VKQSMTVKIIKKILIRLATAILSLVVVVLILFAAAVSNHLKLLVTEAAGISDTQNINGYTGAPNISLDTQDPNVNQRFDLTNMKPGDTFSQNYDLSVKNAADASIELEIIRTSAITTFDLAKKINITVMTKDNENNVTTAFEGTMADFVNNPVTTSISENSNHIVYNIAVSLPEDMGNDYQAQNFSGDLKWVMTDNASVANPKTGNQNTKWLILSFCLAMSAALICVNRKKLLALVKNKKLG
jgi:hypothetical protein